MSPAVTPIQANIDSETRPTCSSCVGELADSALRCTNCKAYVHLRCSGLPDHQLLRLSFTQASYMCLMCIKTKELENDEEKYSAEITKIKELITKEMSIIEQAESEANRSSQTVDIASGDAREVNIESNPGRTKKPGICRLYVNRKCKHGLKGNGCKFEHPKICKYYAKHGDNRSGGCRKGDRCRFAHPKICFQAQGGFACNRKNCNFLHPYGFKYSDGYDNIVNRGNFQLPETVTYAGPIQTQGAVKIANAREVTSITNPQNFMNRETPQVNRQQAGNDFLEIREQLEAQSNTMKIIQQQLATLMRERFSSGPPPDHQQLASNRPYSTPHF